MKQNIGPIAIGIAIFPHHGLDAEALLQRAKQALHTAAATAPFLCPRPPAAGFAVGVGVSVGLWVARITFQHTPPSCG